MTTWRRRVLWASAFGVLGAAAVAGWLGWTARQAHAELVAARGELPAVRTAVLSGDGSAAGALDRVRRHADAADDVTHDPVWTVLAHVPWLGSPIATTRGLTGAVRQLADTGMPSLVQAADAVHPSHLLAGGGRFDVVGLAAAQPSLARAAQVLGTQRDDVARLSPSWVGPVSQARADLLAELTSLAGTSQDATQAARLLPPMLGLNGPRRYFVAFQNPAEARGTGGLLDAYAIILADHGRVTVERTGANTQLPPFTGEVTGLDPAFVARYSPEGGTTEWLNANLSPNFPDAARTWEAMWRKATGQQLDGALALDPRALAATLTATGPVTAPVVGKVDASRIEPLVLHGQYELAEPNSARKSLMLGVGTAVIDALLKGDASPRALLPGLQAATRDGHVKVQSVVAAEEAELVAAGIGGAVDPTPEPFAQAVMVNAAGNKLDSWLGSTLDYRVLTCSASSRTAQVTVTLTNSAPRSGLPQYVTVRSDQPLTTTVPGENRTELQVLVTRGATLTSATLDGGALPLSPPSGELPATLPDGAVGFLQQGEAGGHPAYWTDVEVAPGGKRTLVLRLTEPPSTRTPVLPVQPMVLSTKISSDVGACGGVSGSAA